MIPDLGCASLFYKSVFPSLIRDTRCKALSGFSCVLLRGSGARVSPVSYCETRTFLGTMHSLETMFGFSLEKKVIDMKRRSIDLRVSWCNLCNRMNSRRKTGKQEERYIFRSSCVWPRWVRSPDFDTQQGARCFTLKTDGYSSHTSFVLYGIDAPLGNIGTSSNWKRGGVPADGGPLSMLPLQQLGLTEVA